MVGMDPKGARTLKDLFRALAKNGTTVFLSTHSIGVAEEICHRIGIIQNRPADRLRLDERDPCARPPATTATSKASFSNSPASRNWQMHGGQAALTMTSVALLLSPLWLSWKNSFFRGGGSWTRRFLLALLAASFWLGTYLVIRRVLRYFETVSRSRARPSPINCC